MKKIIILILISISITALSQVQCPPNNGDNINRPELDKFEGTWKYVNGNTEAIIIMKKIHKTYAMAAGESYSEDVLKGVLKITNNSQILFDNLSDYALLLKNQNFPTKFDLGVDCNVNEPDNVKGILRDVPKQKYVTFEVSYVSISIPEILVHQSNLERFGLINFDGTVVSEDLSHPNGTFNPGFTLPNDVNFIKQP